MALEFDPTQQWDRVASELRAHKRTQEQAWGDIDNATLGRYLADDLSSDERQQIEQALTELPELRKLTDIVRDVLDEFEPAAPMPLEAAPRVLPFPQPRPGKRPFVRLLRQRGALLAAACVLLALSLTLGMRLFGSKPSTNPTTHLDEQQAERPNGREKGFEVAAVVSKDKSGPLHADSNKSSQPSEREMIDGWKKLGNSTVTLAAATQEQVGTYYQKNGDYDRAEPYLASAHELRRKSQDKGDSETEKATENLANVYQLALNTTPVESFPTGVPTQTMTPAPPHHEFHAPGGPDPRAGYTMVFHKLAIRQAPLPLGAAALAMLVKRDHDYEQACQLRERITKQSPEAIKQSVVPILVHGFRTAKTPRERQTFVRALGTLGPTAADALQDLQAALEMKETTDEERVAVAWALGQMGPAARPAIPALMDTLQGNSAELKRVAGDALVKLSPYGRQDVFANPMKDTLPRDIQTRMASPEGRSGVNDACLAYSPHALNETQRQIQQLARRHHVELYTETVATLTGKDAKNAAERMKDAKNNGIYILICKEPPSVQVVVSEDMQKKGFAPECAVELKKVAEEGVKKRDFERGLVQSVRYVTKRFDLATSQAKSAAGAVVGGMAESIVPQ